MKARLAMAVLALGMAAVSCGDEDESTAPAFTPLVFRADLDGASQRPTAVDVPASRATSSLVTWATRGVYADISPPGRACRRV